MSGVSSGRAAVLDAVRRADGPTTAAAIADQLDVHVNTVRFHLENMLEAGQVERVPVEVSTPGRPPHAYRPVRRMDPTGPRQFVELARVLTDGLAREPDSRQRAVGLGLRWGRQVAATTDRSLVALLDDFDFAPDADGSDPSVIRLRHCPFLELAEEHAEIVCPIHLGLMQGALQEWGSDLTVADLEAFVEPDLCLVHVTTPEEKR